MTNIANVEAGARISFEVIPDAYLSNNFTNVVLEMVATPRIAQALGLDIAVAHRNVYPSLIAAGVSVPNDPTQYNYVRVTFDGGESVILGVPWIRDGSLVIAAGKKLSLVFDDLDDLRRQRILLAVAAVNEKPSSVTWE
jgi:hypothetical protein